MRFRILLLTLMPAALVSAQENPVPVVDDPMHKTVFENNVVRVIDVQIEPGATTLYHRHTLPSVIVYLTRSTNRSESWPDKAILIRDITPGQSRYAPYDEKPLAHRVTNTGAGLFRVYDIELLNRPAPAAPLPPLASPQVKPQWEERLARSSTVRLPAGGKAEIPSGRSAALVIPIAGAVQVLDGAKAKTPRTLKWGEFQFVPAQTRLEIRPAGSEPAEAVLVELKL
jgi:quercetin dioxygenase-like cupin family protein